VQLNLADPADLRKEARSLSKNIQRGKKGLQVSPAKIEREERPVRTERLSVDDIGLDGSEHKVYPPSFRAVRNARNECWAAYDEW
jgi:hypothetical protein